MNKKDRIMQKNEIKENIIKPLMNKGYHTYFVGGCVRDEILGCTPKDYDVVTDATPDEIHEVFNDRNIIDINSEAFGIVVLSLFGENVEIATMREDRECDGRHTNVTYTKNIRTDALRRDFTINALYMDIDDNIIDPLNQGLQDINDGILRFVGDTIDRCKEDNLRILRAFRFLSCKSDKNGNMLKFINDDEVRRLFNYKWFFESFIDRVSPERVGMEMTKLFGGSHCVSAVRILYDNLVNTEFASSDAILPKELFMLELQPCHEVHHSDNNLIHSFTVFESVAKDNLGWIANVCALCHDLGKVIVQNEKGIARGHEFETYKIIYEFVRSHWKLTKIDSQRIANICGIHMKPHHLARTKKPEKIWKFVSEWNGENIKIILSVLKGDCLDVVDIIPSDYDLFTSFNIDEYSRHRYPCISGHYLMNLVPSGEFFKDGLDYVNKMIAKMRIEKGYDYNPNEKEFKNLLNIAKNIVLTKRSKG